MPRGSRDAEQRLAAKLTAPCNELATHTLQASIVGKARAKEKAIARISVLRQK